MRKTPPSRECPFVFYGKKKKNTTLTYSSSSVALIVQIHLEQNRTDLALKEVTAAKRWAQDSLLINIAESWVGMRVVMLLFSCVEFTVIVPRMATLTGENLLC